MAYTHQNTHSITKYEKVKVNKMDVCEYGVTGKAIKDCLRYKNLQAELDVERKAHQNTKVNHKYLADSNYNIYKVKKQLQADLERQKLYSGGLENAQGFLDEKITNLQAELDIEWKKNLHWKKINKAAAKDNKNLQADLKKYGRCLNNCGSWNSSESVDIPCDCGFEKALKG
ncbi:unnamed protein product [marine sediment metagenome]|uniref:Uncharacterized protein n=1 Tax=marine sediment metagenome TaxID=412755 RepID=X0SYB9_9ZZZZ